MHDCLIIGGGAIGLSLAYDLAGHGVRVRLVDRIQPGRESSWAAAGILPPAHQPADATPHDRLAAFSCRLHPIWAARLREETGIDTGFRACGAMHVADERLLGDLAAIADDWQRGNIAFERLSPEAAVSLESALGPMAASGQLRAALLLPGEVQIRPPWNVRALEAACKNRGVEISSDMEIEDFEIADGVIHAARTAADVICAETYCIAAGAWTGGLMKKIGLQLPIKPVRGQMVLLKTLAPILKRVLYVGGRYFVSREDGRMLVGSTLEDVGFDKRVTADAVQELLDAVLQWLPELRTAEIERCWSGLRPGSADGLPYMGRLPGVRNGFIAAGHYRSGLILAPGTAVLMSQLIRGEEPELDLAPFQVDRN
jgi:glycine oxidase